MEEMHKHNILNVDGTLITQYCFVTLFYIAMCVNLFALLSRELLLLKRF